MSSEDERLRLLAICRRLSRKRLTRTEGWRTVSARVFLSRCTAYHDSYKKIHRGERLTAEYISHILDSGARDAHEIVRQNLCEVDSQKQP